jgi:hypothetical protein
MYVKFFNYTRLNEKNALFITSAPEMAFAIVSDIAAW